MSTPVKSPSNDTVDLNTSASLPAPNQLQQSDQQDVHEFYPESAELALEEQRLLYQAIWESSNALDQKAFQLIGAGTLVLSIAAVFQVSYEMTRSNWYWGIITIALGCLLVSFYKALSAAEPREHDYPQTLDMNELDTKTLSYPKESVIHQFIRRYIKSSTATLDVIKIKAKLLHHSRWLLVAATVLFAVSLIFSL